MQAAGGSLFLGPTGPLCADALLEVGQTQEHSERLESVCSADIQDKEASKQ